MRIPKNAIRSIWTAWFPILIVFCPFTLPAAQESTTVLEVPRIVPIPAKTVVLSFDDAVKSHRTFVGPLLKELGFGATFFVTQAWMNDPENFMSWEDIAELHRMGFEIANHSWTHPGFNTPEAAAKMSEELERIETALAAVGVPKPVSFAWCGNAFCPEGVKVLRDMGYLFARRGMQPEVPYGAMRLGVLYDPQFHEPLLIPSSGDAYPDWTFEHFKSLVDAAKPGKAVLVQFHGVPDIAHPWVHTPPDRFREYMDYLKQEGFNVIALRDLGRYMDPRAEVNDAMAKVRYPAP